MHRAVFAFAFALSLSLGAQAADPASPAKTAQGQRMKECSAKAKDKSLKGDDRKAFMSECLKKKG